MLHFSFLFIKLLLFIYLFFMVHFRAFNRHIRLGAQQKNVTRHLSFNTYDYAHCSSYSGYTRMNVFVPKKAEKRSAYDAKVFRPNTYFEISYDRSLLSRTHICLESTWRIDSVGSSCGDATDGRASPPERTLPKNPDKSLTAL